MRPFTSTISFDEAQQPSARRRRAHRTHGARRPRARRPAGSRRPTSPHRSTCRRSRAPRWTATRSSPRTPRPHRPILPRACGSSSASTPARCLARPSLRGTCAEIATGAPLPDGADAVVMVEQTALDGDNDVSHSGAAQRPARTSDAAAPTSPTGAIVLAARRRAEPRPHRRRRRHRMRRRRRLRAAARRHPVDRQRGRRAGHIRSAPARSSTSTDSR